MSSTVVKVTGLRELHEALRQLPKEVEGPPLYAALRAAAAPMKKDAVAAVPKDTHLIEKRITVARSKINNGKQGLYGIYMRVKPIKAARLKKLGKYDVKNDPFYWRFVEFGTSKMPARPFLRPAFEANKDKAVTIIRDKLKVTIAKAAAKVSRGR